MKSTAAILIPWAQTDWQAAGRYASRTAVAVNDRGSEQLQEWVRLLEEHRPVAIYAEPRDPARQTAEFLGRELKVKVKKSDHLEEISLGLWEGLTPEQLKKRFAKVYKQWRDDPNSVCPPEGEKINQGGQRVLAEVKRLARKHKGEAFGVVLGPLAFAAVRCLLEGLGYDALWGVAQDAPVKYFISPEHDSVATH